MSSLREFRTSLREFETRGRDAVIVAVIAVRSLRTAFRSDFSLNPDCGNSIGGGTTTGRLMIAPRGLANAERDLIRTRTAEGRIGHGSVGSHMGRLPRLTTQKCQEKQQTEGTLCTMGNSLVPIQQNEPRHFWNC